MSQHTLAIYILTFVSSLIMSLILTPAARAAALVLNIIDHPHSDVKTHKEPIPYLGGVAIFLSFIMSLLWVRVLTSFPTGTLRSLRGIFIGGFFIFILGLIDDAKFLGLHYKIKFFFQIAAAVVVMIFGIQIKFIEPPWLGLIFTLLWIVGISNALNLIDIMDGLASGTVFIASMAFLFISLPTEAIYVNFAAAALAGATLGFLPYNLSKKHKIFMGDSGSLFLGFVVSVLAMGTSYKGKTDLGIFAPLLILAVPIIDTLLVFFLRIRKGRSPFLGSKDHYALRMEILGWKRFNIFLFTMGVTLLLGIAAYFTTQMTRDWAILIYSSIFVLLAFFIRYIIRAPVP